MTFQSDLKKMRTWDPDTGWELIKHPSSPGIKLFELRHPEERSFRFSAELVSVKKIDEFLPDGFQKAHRVYRITNVDGPPSKASAAQRKLIEESLYAFGTVHDGPSGPVDVSYFE